MYSDVTPPSPPSALHFFFNDTATTEIYTLSLHDALPIFVRLRLRRRRARAPGRSQPPLLAAGARRHRIVWRRADRSAALRSGGHGRDRVRLALLSAGGALGGHRVDSAMAATRLGTGRFSALDARGHRLDPARDHDPWRQMTFLLPALMLVGLAAA